MQPRSSLVTLGVADLDGSRTFHETWGWMASSASQPGAVFFPLDEQGHLFLPDQVP